MIVPFAQIDAFADRPFTGNPAAVVPLDAWPDDALLAAIAEENNLAETAFYVRAADGSADFELRWFTPESEIDLCGHATLASGHHILSKTPDMPEVRFQTRRSGLLTVRRANAGYSLDLPIISTTPARLPEAERAIGITALETESHANGYHIFRLDDEAAVRAANPDFRALAAMGAVQFIITAEGTSSDVVSRVFVPGAGVDEDSVTGSAHAALTPFWTKRLERGRFTAFQASRRGGYVECHLDRDKVVLAGECVTVIEGEMTLP